MRNPWLAQTIPATLAVLSLAALSSMAAERSIADRIGRFQLFNECRSMAVSVLAKGLPNTNLNAAVESRLLTAGLFDVEAGSRLILRVDIAGSAFNSFLGYKKLVVDPTTSELFHATTWYISRTGMYDDANFIYGKVAQDVDQFILEYLKVNQEACAEKPPSEKAAQ